MSNYRFSNIIRNNQTIVGWTAITPLSYSTITKLHTLSIMKRDRPESGDIIEFINENGQDIDARYRLLSLTPKPNNMLHATATQL